MASMAETAAEANENKDSFMNTELGGKVQSTIQTEMIKFMKGKSSTEGTVLNMAHFTDFAGPSD